MKMLVVLLPCERDDRFLPVNEGQLLEVSVQWSTSDGGKHWRNWSGHRVEMRTIDASRSVLDSASRL